MPPLAVAAIVSLGKSRVMPPKISCNRSAKGRTRPSEDSAFSAFVRALALETSADLPCFRNSAATDSTQRSRIG